MFAGHTISVGLVMVIVAGEAEVFAFTPAPPAAELR
jgi:hypothetical protein